MGTLPGKYYGWNRAGSWIQGTAKGIHDLHRSSKFGLSGKIVDVCSVNRIGLAVIDGTYVLDGQYTTHEANMAIAGFDPVATDSVAYRIMGFDPKRYLHMRLAVKKRLGTFGLSKIEIKRESIEKVKLKGIAKLSSASPARAR